MIAPRDVLERDRAVLSGNEYRHLYVHVPFCARRCSYCDFSIAVRRNVPVQEYVSALESELEIRRSAHDVIELDTVYVGGGTPSRLGVDGVSQLMSVLRSRANIASDAEVTLEVNPDDISADAVRRWRSAGVNRLSIGIQSFHDNVLSWMHRAHTGDDARVAVRIARDSGISAVSVDLIFALPDNLERDWPRDVDGILALEPQHISLYGLTIEKGTPLAAWQARGEVSAASEERYEQEFLSAHENLTAAGFEHYEVSNFGLPSHRARHNSAYWSGAPYLGVGPSAHGFDGSARRWNIAAYAHWQRAVAAGNDPIAGEELLSTENRVAESVYLSLRTRDGLVVSETDLPLIDRWRKAGWIEDVCSEEKDSQVVRVRCTPYGWLRLDALAADLTLGRSC